MTGAPLWAQQSIATTLSEYLPNQCEYAGDFNQIRELKDVPVPLASSGKFVFSCNLGLLWQISHPLRETIVYSADSGHFKVDDAGNITLLTGVVHNNMAKLLHALMGGDQQYLLDLFSAVEQSSEEKIILTPKSQSVARHLTQVELSKMHRPVSIRMLNGDSGTTLLEPSNILSFDGLTRQQCKSWVEHNMEACNVLFEPDIQRRNLNSDK